MRQVVRGRKLRIRGWRENVEGNWALVGVLSLALVLGSNRCVFVSGKLLKDKLSKH